MIPACKFLHSLNITHRDIKPENIYMVSQKPYSQIKLADVWLAKVTHSNTQMKTVCGTYHYLAPEVFRSNNRRAFDKSVDFWSCGNLFFVMLGGQLSFQGEDLE